ncbi:MAG: penicillin-binding protein 2 [Pseudomonadota bacterium]|nr:penicillin-binding protein 2 [Gammaproteobacteria bacterium]MBU2546171.1 penicillin-binding protein 2 [Gammaproteobacteria bacterium]
MEFLRIRFYFVLFFLLLMVGSLIARVVYLTIYDRAFLQKQGNARILRSVKIPAYRGMIVDRNGDPLAVSTPVDSVWVNPQDFPNTYANVIHLQNLLHLSSQKIEHIVRSNAKRQFVYLRRNLSPQVAKQIQELAIPGVYLQHGFKRFYPQAEVSSQLVGFTNIDDQGQAGLEMAYNTWLEGALGAQRVVQDRYGHIVAVIAGIKAAKPGNDLTLSIDNRIQFLAYSVLKTTVERVEAESGSVVVLNPKTGEVLAMVNQPSFNPNNLPRHNYGQFRNRAVTDMFEPGSTMKAFSIANALESGKYQPSTLINTSPGWLMIGRNRVLDDNLNYGTISVTQVLQKSSNVGVTKMTLSLPPAHFINLLRSVGFGERSQSGFPGESPGSLVDHRWRPFELATLAFGYGISVTPLQLAQAYAAIANGGMKCPITFLKRDEPVQCQQALRAKTANEMLKMLETVVEIGGTGVRARVTGYAIAGKTGTAYIAGKHGYDKENKKMIASFVGIAPVSDPQLVVEVVVREPKLKKYGGLVAAPAFSKIMDGALRIMNIPPSVAAGSH